MRAEHLRNRELAGLTNPVVACLDEVYRELPVRKVCVLTLRQWRCIEVLERRKKPNGRVVLRDQVLQEKEFHVARKIAKEHEKVRVPCESVTQWSTFIAVVLPDALHREIESILDPRMESALAIYCHLAINEVARVESEFYPQIGALYEQRIRAWAAAQQVEESQGELDPVSGASE